MTKRFSFALGALLIVSSLFAQEAVPSAWKWSGIVGLNTSATGMVNWSAGGKNNITGTAFGKVRCLYEKDNLSWDTNLDMTYGLSYVDQTYDKLQKSSDHLKFNSKFGWAFHSKWYLSVNAGFQTQFDLGRKYMGTGAFNPILSNILAPSYTDISVGIDWKPNSIFSLYLSPVAGRITTAYISESLNNRYADEYALADGGLRQALKESYGVWHYANNGEHGYSKDYTNNAKPELGLTFKGNINYSYKDLKIITGLTLYTPYAWDKTQLYETADGIFSAEQCLDKSLNLSELKYLGYRDNNRRFGRFDVNWDVTLSYQLLKCLNITLTTDMRYVNGLKIADSEGNNPKERLQFLANLGLGVSYAF